MPLVIVNGKGKIVQPSRQMSGEKIPGDLRNWDYMGTDANNILLWTYDVLSQRSTTLYHTHPPVTAAINKTTNYAIGPGLKFRSQPDWDILGWSKDKAKDWGMRFQKLVHYMCLLLNYYEKQSIIFRTGKIMGDSLLFFDRTKPVDNMPFDLIETGGDQIDFQYKKDDKCTLGIFHDDMLRKHGIKKYNKDAMIPFKNNNGDQNVVQFYQKLIARQLRGYPAAYRIIASAKNNDRWWDATLARLVMETIIFAQTKENTSGDTQRMLDTIADTLYSEDGTQSAKYQRDNVADGAPGSVLSYTGKDNGIEFTDLKTPSNNFDKVQSAYIDMVGMAMDIPPECILSKYSTSYTAHKGALNDFQKAYMQQRGLFASNVNDVVVKEIAKYLFREQMIEMPQGFFDNPIIQMAALKGIWLGPVPGHINPKQEVDALKVAKDEAFITPADAAATFANVEWDDQIEEWSRQMEEWQKFAPEKQAETIGREMDEQEEQNVTPVEDAEEGEE